MDSLNSPNQETIHKVGQLVRETEGEYWDLRGKTEIVQIFVAYGKCVHSISFQYLENEKLIMSPMFGSSTFEGPGFKAVKLDYPSEYITGVSMHYDSRIKTLSILTNKDTYGPFGRAKYNWENQFTIDIGSHNQFAGFHGTHDSHSLESIGLYFKPRTTLCPFKGKRQGNYGGKKENSMPSRGDYDDDDGDDGNGGGDYDDDGYMD